MPQHFTRSTISAEFYCPTCRKPTQHRIDDRRKGPCLECIARLETKHSALSKRVPEKQGQLFLSETL
jgi:ribosomal protein L44E